MADVAKSSAPEQPEKVDGAAAAADSTAPAAAAADDDVKMDDAPSSVPKDGASEKTAATEAAAATDKAEKPAASEDVEMRDSKPEDDAPKAGESADGSALPAGDEDSATKAADKEDASDKASQMDVDTQPGQSETAAEANGAGSAQPTAHRKSIGAATPKGKLNKKASKGRILHVDCKPGDHFFARLKGFPPWPVIIADEDMLPETMLSTRPVTAARPDGSYRFDFAEGGKRVADRTFPVMYLHTNEFSWTRNTDLQDLDPSIVRDQISAKMRKDLQQAHHLAAEQHSLEYYKQLLLDFQEAKIADQEAKVAKAQAKKEKAEKSSKKSEAVAIDEDDDDMDLDDIGEDDAALKKAKPAKKRKADEEVGTPQRSDSVKKPKIKLTTSATPKAAANGAPSPQAGKESAVKAPKTKSKTAKGSKEAEGKKTEEKAAPPKEPELTPEERHLRKEKEILFLRHRLQKGLLNRDSEPKEDEMKPMSEFLAKLETFPDLEAAIIKATKINKVLKAILKLEGVPKEEEFKFKPRSQSLLDKWNKTLAAEPTTTPAPAAAPANGVNGVPSKEAAPSVDKDTNGAGAAGDAEESAKAEKVKADESKEVPKEAEAPPKAEEEKPAAEDGTAAAQPATVEPAA